MFQPSQSDVRQFFCSVYAKSLLPNGNTVNKNGPGGAATMEPIEKLAALWIAEHAEYWPELENVEQALHKDYEALALDSGAGNPFLHLSMHLSISEQCSIDQPRGIRQAVELLAARFGDLHQAQHVVMEALGEMVWEAQRSGKPPDGQRYVETVQRFATRD